MTGEQPTLSAAVLADALLGLLTTRRPQPAQRCADWNAADWTAARTMLAQHRLMPLLHWRLAHEHAHVQVPDAIRTALHDAFRRATMRSLTWNADLARVHRVLGDAGIAHLVLKGPFLANHAYPHPALRPMRDLDVLVKLPTVAAAWDLLLANGFARDAAFPGDPLSFLDIKKHLPPVRAPSGQVLLELHGRLVSPDEVGEAAANALDEEAVWRRRVTMAQAGSGVDYLSPTDLLLHLIVHAAYDHRFDNGPLVLSDIAYLLARHAIDWPLFWALAERGAWTRGARLLLRMVDDWHELDAGVRADSGIAAMAADDGLGHLARTAAQLSLRDVSARRDQETLGVIDVAQGWRRKLRVLAGKAFPSRERVAAQFPIDPRSPKIVLGYLLRWKYVVARSFEMRRSLRGTPAALRGERREDRLRVDSLERWLRAEGDSGR